MNHPASISDLFWHAPWRAACGLAVVVLAGFGVLYALAGVGLGQGMFPAEARGSLVMRGERVAGSLLMAQPFAGPAYFQPRPSAADYDAMALTGSNAARGSPALQQWIAEQRAQVASREGVALTQVPWDLLTRSGSGADPHVSPAGAALQVERVARARGLSRQQVAAAVAQATEGPQWGVLGQPKVNVLQLNLALDALLAAPMIDARE